MITNIYHSLNMRLGCLLSFNDKVDNQTACRMNFYINVSGEYSLITDIHKRIKENIERHEDFKI